MHANRPILALVLLLFVLAAACGKPPAKVPAMPRTEEMTTGQLLREADTAFAAGRFEQSELFYERLIARSDLPAELRPKALERYTDSALAAGHPRNAAAGLERWAATYPEAAADPAWQGAKYRVDLALGRTEAAAGDFAAWAGRTSQPWPERQASGQALANALTSQGEYGQAFQVLSALHAEAPDAAAKARLEEDFRRGLSDTPDETLAAMDAAIGAEGRTIFPGALVRFEEANRLAADSARWPEAWSAMREVVNAGTLADAAPLAEILAGLEAERGVPRLGLALALPLSGRFADVAWSIVRGAGVAQWQLAAIGALVEVVVVNTDAPDWQRQIEGLAPHVTVVGGPLQTETLKSAAAAGLLARRPTFAFLPSLGELTEGRDAWRFFGSFEDQVRSLVEFSVSELGIRRFAVLNPEERFGARMAEIFLREAQARGAVVTATAAYPPKEPTDWGKSVARLLKVPERQGETERLPPTPDFQAVFMPDGWSQAQLLAPHFFYYEAEDQVLLGPELWSQALTKSGEDVEARYFRLALTPGAWWPQAEGFGAVSLRSGLADFGLPAPDFWTALGYDFVRFAFNLGPLPANAAPSEVNARLAAQEAMDWSLAPIRYAADGRASMNMYLFHPTERGPAVVDPGRMRERLDAAHASHQQRVEAIREKLKSGRQ